MIDLEKSGEREEALYTCDYCYCVTFKIYSRTPSSNVTVSFDLRDKSMSLR